MYKSPAQPKTSSAKKSSSGARSAGGRPPAYDWGAIRREYIRGDDTVTLASLAAIPGYPSERQLERRSGAEDWPDLRLQMRREVDGRLRALDLDMKTEVRRRHAEVGKDFLAMAAAGLQGHADRWSRGRYPTSARHLHTSLTQDLYARPTPQPRPTG